MFKSQGRMLIGVLGHVPVPLDGDWDGKCMWGRGGDSAIDHQVPEKQGEGLGRQSNGDLVLPTAFCPPLSWQELGVRVL